MFPSINFYSSSLLLSTRKRQVAWKAIFIYLIWDAEPIIRDYYIALLRPLKHLPINQENKTLNFH
ncbi:unnamed protein product [Callosobruchus maculatus]|uniref:Uncharacterized protein n=1 Tax=Callosobruchus maculatus TaxID=64391 RepID=A0A653DGL4_CALMS|nr:unnamed protein product [Callosobruchus maculatus]